MSETTQISISDAEALMEAALTAAAIPERVARSVAKALTAAEAEGQAGHGFSRLADYIAQAKSGKIRADATVEFHDRGAAALFIDAGQGFAYPALDAALNAGLPKAHEHGACVMAVGNSHHCGALSVQVEKVAKAGLIGLMVANTPKAIAPWGAREAMFGTNPIAFATPQDGAEPLVIDLSLSQVARGKVLAAKKAGRDIPDGWALDAGGQPTTDPTAGLAGTMVPIGEAKGTALALMVELLAAAFTGSAFSSEAGSFFNADGPPPRVGQTIIALRPDATSNYFARTRELLSTIAALDGTRLPGERRRKAIAQATAHGIAVPTNLLAEARRLAKLA
ncbi:MAG: Ldh family oxidoreductase [Pseudomonadota bacterium]